MVSIAHCGEREREMKSGDEREPSQPASEEQELEWRQQSSQCGKPDSMMDGCFLPGITCETLYCLDAEGLVNVFLNDS